MGEIATVGHEPAIHFEVFPEVWEVEEADIKNFLAGNHGDSAVRAVSKAGEKVGISKLGFQVAASVIPGGMVPALVGGLAVVMKDSLAGNKLDLAAMATRQLIKFEGIPPSQLDWDFLEEAASNIDSWLLPRLKSRLEILQELAKSTGGHEEVVLRVGKYEKAVEEVKSAGQLLRVQLQKVETSWQASDLHHRTYEAAQMTTRQQELLAIEGGVNALLWDRATADAKKEEIESKYERLRCTHSRLLSRCQRLAQAGCGLCPDHRCALEGCSLVRVGGSHYCKTHSKMEARDEERLRLMSKMGASRIESEDRNAEAHRQDSGSGQSTGDSRGMPGWLKFVLVAIALLLVLAWLGS